MSFFSQPSLKAPSASFHKKSYGVVHSQEADSSDLEVSFASNVSLNSPRQEQLLLPSSDCEPMDISPAPVVKHARPRAFTSGARLFGSDISNANASLFPSPYLVVDSVSKPSPTETQSGSKRIQRSALPVEWLSSNRAQEPAPLQPVQQPSSPSDDAMDVDTSYVAESVSFSPVPHSAAPAITGFNQLFYDTLSPRRSHESSPLGPLPKKRRSLSPESTGALKHDDPSSPILPSSPSEAKLERISNGAIPSRSGKPSLSGLGAPSATFKRRRPVLSAMAQPYEHNNIQSAYPILSPPGSGASNKDDSSPIGSAPVRRAFSAFLPTSIYTEQSEEDSSFDGQDMSSPAQAYSKRQHVKTIRRCDGTEDFRPVTGATAMVQKESPSAKFMAAGLPGFGDNEAHGKVLPCHRVTEDGLMRISCQTLDDLMDGKYCNEITDFRIIDCRFDYEYNGGHIPGAVNVNTTTAVEEFLLGTCLTKPKPSVSGDNARKSILVFHCEFSFKRAPTFAKHLRARDRAMNNHLYPKIHYPEVYILEGGYCQYFKTSSHRCQPSGYVKMDDPNHASSRREDLDQFRKAKFGRHKSYAYGDVASKSLSFGQPPSQQQRKHNTVPGAPQSLFAAATAARSRRGGNGLMTLVEDGNATADADDTDTDVGDSPCPPPVKSTSFKGKKLARGIVRSETYGPTRMNY